ncbi:hypothetical protein LC603019_00833 [Lawsonella clevelandensis]|uniref:Uncharacterized protein n=2 Tax=Lawsonella clevelandensis TaxID=1528099 RepID=A0A5E3ZY93_9ACTN|nr:hypothetical protein LC603019_00833 [Lawsonella clevelandensis]
MFEMNIRVDDLQLASKKLQKLVSDIDITSYNKCSFHGLSSQLVSLQSIFNQINALADSNHGLLKVMTWHASEGDCVWQALAKQCETLNYVDDDFGEILDLVYDNISGNLKHEPHYQKGMQDLGKGFELKNGEHYLTYASHGIEIVEEPLEQDVSALAVGFSKYDPSTFYECATAWVDASKNLSHLADGIKKIASEVENSGSQGTFTSAAGEGIRRWSVSIDQLSRRTHEIGSRLDAFTRSYAETRTHLNAIADESERAQTKAAAEQKPFDGSRYSEEANAVLRNHYNPQLHEVDTSKVEFPVPLRAFKSDYDPSTPPQRSFIPANSNGVVDAPFIAASPAGAKSVLAQPVVPPPDTTDIPKATPGKGMPPAETTPNAAHPLPPSQGSGVGSVSGPTSMASGTTPSPATPAGTTTAGAAGSAGHPSAGYLGGYPSHWNNPHQSPHKNRESRPHTNLVVGAGAFGTGLSTGSSDRVVPKGGALRAIPGAGQTPGTAGTNPNTPTSSSTKAPAGSGSPAKSGTNPNTPTTSTGRPGTSGIPGTPGTGTSHNTTSKTTPRRPRRSAHNTERILPKPGGIRGPIRHPDDPLYGTGR